jgi:adenosine deaminase
MDRFIESLPKTETHLHIEGAIPWELFELRFPGEFPKVPKFRMPDFRYDDFQQFEKILISHALRVIKCPDDYAEVAKMLFAKQLSQNISYVELSFHAGMIEFLKIRGEDIIQAIRSVVPDGLEVRIFMGMSRDSYTSFLGPLLEEAVENWEGLYGIDLHGPEDLPTKDWMPRLWSVANANGRILKAHAGEFGSAQNVKWAVEKLGVKRIQHGINASSDETVLDLLAEKGVVLDLCPISNYKLRVFDNWNDYPIRKFLKKGIRCTISTDDPFSFGNCLNDEYKYLVRYMDFSASEIAGIAKTGFDTADLQDYQKKESINQIDHLLTLEEGNRL